MAQASSSRGNGALRWRNLWVLRWVLAAASLAGFACSSDAPSSQPLRGAPTTGEQPTAEGDGIVGPTDAQVHEARVKSVLAKAGLDGDRELARWGGAPLVEARIELSHGPASASAPGSADRAGGGRGGDPTFEGRWQVSAVNGGPEVLRSIAFELPVNHLPGRAAAVSLVGVKVGGTTVSAGGTTTRWEIPVDVAPGKRVEVELTFAGALPAVAPDAAAPVGASDPARPGAKGVFDLDALLGQMRSSDELRRMVPVVPIVDGVSSFARFADVSVLAGCLPRLVELPVGVVALEVLAPAELEVDATGRRIGSERDGARVKHRFAALGEPETAIVVSRGLAATTSVVAEVPVMLRTARPVSPELIALLRRALEDYQTRWGAFGPAELTVIAVEGATGVSGLSGIVLVPAQLLDAVGPPAGAAAGAPAAGLSLAGVLGDMLEHHPAAREALAFAVATAVAQEWWAGVGSDAAADTVLKSGFARAGALAVVAGKSGDKAERRALELGLKLPIQLALQQGGKDVVLAAGSPADAATASLAGLKAGLFIASLGRHLGEPTMVTLASRLLTGAGVTLATFRAEVLALAPRPEETRVFLARWLDERHLAEDVGPLRPEVLLEYLVSDGAIGSLTSQLMGQLGPGQLGGRALELLGQGKELDAGLALTLLGELAAKDADPTMKKWLTLGTDLLGGTDDKKRAVEALVDELGAELGIPESERSRLRQLSAQLFDALGKEMQDAPDPGMAPAPPAPQQP